MKISVLEIFKSEKTKIFYNLCNKKRRLRQKCAKGKIMVYNAESEDGNRTIPLLHPPL